MKDFGLYLATCLCLFLGLSNYANAEEDHVSAHLIANTKAIVPGQDFKLGVKLTMQPGWHTYYKDSGDAGIPTKIIWQLPPGFHAHNLYWQKPQHFNDAGIITYGYSQQTIIATDISPPPQLQEKNIDFRANVKWLSCKEICLPGKADIQLSLPVANADQINYDGLKINSDTFSSANIVDKNQPVIEIQSSPSRNNPKTNLVVYLFFGLIGGFLLNFMPCVLPVVAIKILSLLQQSDVQGSRRAVFAFSTGIISSFLILGLLIAGLQTAGQKVGWGFQFQQPLFLIFMSCLVLIFALSLFGICEFSFSVGQKAVDQLASKEGFYGDFFKGVLATILSTPCTAPFLGTALGFAFVQSWTITLSIFLAIGIGMSSPYLLLMIAPQYLKYLPKPGDWMTHLKQSFGFVLLATVFWLLSILYYEIPIPSTIAFTYFLLSLAFIVWLLHSFTNLASSQKRIFGMRALAVLIFICSFYLFIYPYMSTYFVANPIEPSNARANNTDSQFDMQQLNQALTDKKTVFLDFTAKWCLTCQFNELTVLNTPDIQKKLRSLNVLFLKADWTKQDPTVTQLLKRFNRSGVPLYVIFPAKDPTHPIVLPELITKDLVLQKLDEAGPSMP